MLSEKGANWEAVGASVTENNTVENIERIFKAAKVNGYDVFISPHYLALSRPALAGLDLWRLFSTMTKINYAGYRFPPEVI